MEAKMTLTLEPGPKLLLSRYDLEDQEDVTSQAIEFLFDSVSIDPGITLADLFGLFEACPGLKPPYKRWYVDELCERALLGPLPAEGIMHLELKQRWQFDSHKREYADAMLLDFFAVGPVREVCGENEYVYPDGFVHYSVAGSDVRHLLTLPVRYNNQVDVWENDTHSINNGRLIQNYTCRDIQLGAMLNAVVYSLTWFGVVVSDADEIVGDEVSGELEDLIQAVNDSDTEWSSADPNFMDRIFDWVAHSAWVTHFISIGNLSEKQVSAELRRIPDGCNAARWLSKNLGREVVVQKAYRHMDGRDFRAALSKPSG